jgi:hypothetical protein
LEWVQFGYTFDRLPGDEHEVDNIRQTEADREIWFERGAEGGRGLSLSGGCRERALMLRSYRPIGRQQDDWRLYYRISFSAKGLPESASFTYTPQ